MLTPTSPAASRSLYSQMPSVLYASTLRTVTGNLGLGKWSRSASDVSDFAVSRIFVTTLAYLPLRSE
jgi:hypothetical protein